MIYLFVTVTVFVAAFYQYRRVQMPLLLLSRRFQFPFYCFLLNIDTNIDTF